MYLEDLFQAMARIAEYIEGYSFIEFKRDYKTVDAVIRNFEIIGEASKNLPQELKEKYPDVPWAEMYLLRNKVSHEYFGIDYEIIWDVAKNYLPENKSQIAVILTMVSKSKNTYSIPSLDKIDQVATEFMATYNEPAVFCFYGSMGAGKTTFIQALCHQLHVVDVVNSPSFSIVNEYDTDKGNKVYHFDFYRLKEEDEAFDLGYEDYFYSDNYCFVEWPEKIASLLPAKRYDVNISVLDDNSSRVIEVTEQ